MNRRAAAVVLVGLMLAPTLILAGTQRLGHSGALAQPGGTVNVDNNSSNRTATGEVADQSNWPYTIIRIENNHSFWLRVMDQPPTNEVEILYDDSATNKWAEWGYIPPYGTAIYAVRFDPDNDSHLQFLVNGAASVDGSIPAGVWSATERAFDLALLTLGQPGTFQDATLPMLIRFTETMADLPACVDAFEPVFDQGVLDTAKLTINVTQCLSSEEYAEALVEMLGVFGAETSIEEVTRSVLTQTSVGDIFNNFFDTWYAILAGEYAGGIQFNSLLGFPEPSADPDSVTVPAATPAAESELAQTLTLTEDEIRQRVENAIAEAGSYRSESSQTKPISQPLAVTEVDLSAGIKISDSTGYVSYCSNGTMYSRTNEIWTVYDNGGPCTDWEMDDIFNWLWDPSIGWEFTGTQSLDGGATLILEWRWEDPNSQYQGSSVISYWIDGDTYLPVRKLRTYYISDGQTDEYETLYSGWGEPVDVEVPAEAFVPAPAPVTLVESVSNTDPQQLLDALASTSFPDDRLPSGFSSAREERMALGDLREQTTVAFGGVEVLVSTPSQLEGDEFRILYYVYDSQQEAEVDLYDGIEIAEREGLNVWYPGAFPEISVVMSLSLVHSSAVAYVLIGNVIVVGFSTLEIPNLAAAETNAIDLAWAGRNHLEMVLGTDPGLSSQLPQEISADEVWSVESYFIIRSSPLIVEDTLYVADRGGSAYAINVDSGHVLWTYGAGDAVWSSPFFSEGILYIGSDGPPDSDGYGGTVFALNAETGKEIWSFKAESPVRSSPVVSDGVLYVGSGSDSGAFYDIGQFYAIDAQSGVLLWTFDPGSAVLSTPTIVDGIVYINASRNDLFALDALTGREIWNHSSSGTHYYSLGDGFVSSPAVVNGVVYVGDSDDNLYAIDSATGDRIWSFDTGWGISSSPTVAFGMVYVGSGDDNFYAVDAVSGEEIWRFASHEAIKSSPTIVGSLVYVGSNDGFLYALEATSGKVAWRYDTGGAILSTPAVSNGVVYVANDLGLVLAITAIAQSESHLDATPAVVFGPDVTPTAIISVVDASPVAPPHSVSVVRVDASPVATGEATGFEATPAVAVTDTAVQVVTVTSADIFFEPHTVTIASDTEQRFRLPNEGAAPHNFSIDELEIDVDLDPGESQETVINAPVGEYEFYCNVPGHREAGMVGTLVVENKVGASADLTSQVIVPDVIAEEGLSLDESDASRPETDPSVPSSDGTELYVADWSQEPIEWAWFHNSNESDRWKIRDSMLVYDDLAGTPLPHSPSTQTMGVLCGCWSTPPTSVALAALELPGNGFAIETEIRVVRSEIFSSFSIAGFDGNIVVAVNGGGYVIPFLGMDEYPGVRFDPGSNWHLYRLEIRSNSFDLLVDGNLILSLDHDLDISTSDARVGLASQLHQLEVRSFRVVELGDV